MQWKLVEITWVASLRSLRIFSSSLLPSLSSSILSTWGNVDMLLRHPLLCCCRIDLFHVTWMTVVTSNSSSTPSSSTPKECSSGAMEEGEILGVGRETTSSDVGLLLGLFNSSHLLSGWFNRRCSHTLTGNHHRNQVYAKDRDIWLKFRLTW